MEKETEDSLSLVSVCVPSSSIQNQQGTQYTQPSPPQMKEKKKKKSKEEENTSG
jgi:hypothetical protein